MGTPSNGAGQNGAGPPGGLGMGRQVGGVSDEGVAAPFGEETFNVSNPNSLILLEGKSEGEGEAEELDLSFLPTLAMVFLGLSFTMVQWSGLRFNAILKLEKETPPTVMLEKMLKQRKLKKKCADFECNIVSNCMNKWQPPTQRKLSGGYVIRPPLPLPPPSRPLRFFFG